MVSGAERGSVNVKLDHMATQRITASWARVKTLCWTAGDMFNVRDAPKRWLGTKIGCHSLEPHASSASELSEASQAVQTSSGATAGESRDRGDVDATTGSVRRADAGRTSIHERRTSPIPNMSVCDFEQSR